MLKPIDYEEPEFDPIQAFTKIKNFLSKFPTDNWENPHRYIIEEYFPNGHSNYMPNTYELLNITLDIENDGVAYFNDAEGILLEALDNNIHLPLQAVTMNDVIDVSISKFYKWITISTDDGYIRIKY
jgi:hypothetical protein